MPRAVILQGTPIYYTVRIKLLLDIYCLLCKKVLAFYSLGWAVNIVKNLTPKIIGNCIYCAEFQNFSWEYSFNLSLQFFYYLRRNNYRIIVNATETLDDALLHYSGAKLHELITMLFPNENTFPAPQNFLCSSTRQNYFRTANLKPG